MQPQPKPITDFNKILSMCDFDSWSTQLVSSEELISIVNDIGKSISFPTAKNFKYTTLRGWLQYGFPKPLKISSGRGLRGYYWGGLALVIVLILNDRIGGKPLSDIIRNVMDRQLIYARFDMDFQHWILFYFSYSPYIALKQLKEQKAEEVSILLRTGTLKEVKDVISKLEREEKRVEKELSNVREELQTTEDPTDIPDHKQTVSLIRHGIQIAPFFVKDDKERELALHKSKRIMSKEIIDFETLRDFCLNYYKGQSYSPDGNVRTMTGLFEAIEGQKR